MAQLASQLEELVSDKGKILLSTQYEVSACCPRGAQMPGCYLGNREADRGSPIMSG